MPSARTRLPRRVNHLYVSSYFSGTVANIVLMVSGAPLTATKPRPPESVDTVDMRFKAEENWNLRRILSDVRCGAAAEDGVTVSPLEICHSRASRVVFSIGSPTIVPSSRRTSACAPARQSVVVRLLSLTLTSFKPSVWLDKSIQQRPGHRSGSDSLNTGNTLQHQVFSSDSPRFVKAAYVHATRIRNTEWLGTEYR